MIIIQSIPRTFLISQVSPALRKELWGLLQNVYSEKNEHILYCLPDQNFKPILASYLTPDIKEQIVFTFSGQKIEVKNKRIEIIVIDGPHLFYLSELIFLLQLRLPIVFLSPYSFDHILTGQLFFKLKGFGLALPEEAPSFIQKLLNYFRKKYLPPNFTPYLHCIAYILSLEFCVLVRKHNVIWPFILASHKKNKFLKNYVRNETCKQK